LYIGVYLYPVACSNGGRLALSIFYKEYYATTQRVLLTVNVWNNRLFHLYSGLAVLGSCSIVCPGRCLGVRRWHIPSGRSRTIHDPTWARSVTCRGDITNGCSVDAVGRNVVCTGWIDHVTLVDAISCGGGRERPVTSVRESRMYYTEFGSLLRK
jgi:hypothetical protein